MYCAPYQDLTEWPEILMSVSIDVGLKNTALRVIQRQRDGYKVILRDRVGFGSDKIEPIEYPKRIIQYFRDRVQLWQHCNLILIENQIYKKNPLAFAIQNLIYGYYVQCMMEHQVTGRIYNIQPRLKGEKLGAPKKTVRDTKALKRWSICQAIVYSYQSGEHSLFQQLIKPKELPVITQLIKNGYTGNQLFRYLEECRDRDDFRSNDTAGKTFNLFISGKADDESDVLNQERAFLQHNQIPMGHQCLSDYQPNCLIIEN